MDTSIVVAVVGIAGIIAGAVLQFLLGKKIESSKQFKILQTQAYVDFIRGFAGIGRAQFFGDKEKEVDYTILLAESKARVSIYGSEKVVRATAVFISQFNETYSEKGQMAFASLVSTMRDESIGKIDSVTKDQIWDVLYARTSNEKTLDK